MVRKKVSKAYEPKAAPEVKAVQEVIRPSDNGEG
jgi:hypothetical protein